MKTYAHGDIIEYEGDTWTVIGVGITAIGPCAMEGQTYLQLASTTRFIVQRNGRRPVMIATWV